MVGGFQSLNGLDMFRPTACKVGSGSGLLEASGPEGLGVSRPIVFFRVSLINAHWSNAGKLWSPET